MQSLSNVITLQTYTSVYTRYKFGINLCIHLLCNHLQEGKRVYFMILVTICESLRFSLLYLKSGHVASYVPQQQRYCWVSKNLQPIELQWKFPRVLGTLWSLYETLLCYVTTHPPCCRQLTSHGLFSKIQASFLPGLANSTEIQNP